MVAADASTATLRLSTTSAAHPVLRRSASHSGDTERAQNAIAGNESISAPTMIAASNVHARIDPASVRHWNPLVIHEPSREPSSMRLSRSFALFAGSVSASTASGPRGLRIAEYA